ncbi:hypothetical protein PR048_026001 [Dryococelus australis]|uniref:Uncharacterized protein n=1 Tax=Dryococelus australis TaxID=614101 RepID=A0ABQ9GK61_9NEOP|nr:hypothetical protein PR048_026001 [Dryococelus australis]
MGSLGSLPRPSAELQLCLLGLVVMSWPSGHAAGENLVCSIRQRARQRDLEDIPLATRDGMYLQHIGDPAHSTRPVVHLLDEPYPSRWIGCGGAVAWPPRSPDLTPLDCCSWESAGGRNSLSRGKLHPRKSNYYASTSARRGNQRARTWRLMAVLVAFAPINLVHSYCDACCGNHFTSLGPVRLLNPLNTGASSCVFIGCCPTLGSSGIRKVFPRKRAIGSEECRAGRINCDPIAKTSDTYNEVTFAIGSQFIRPALHASEPIADLQENTLRIPLTARCRATANEHTAEAPTTRLPPRRTGLHSRLGFSHMGIALDGAASRQFLLGISRFARPCIPALLHSHLISPPSALKTSTLRATQISPLFQYNLFVSPGAAVAERLACSPPTEANFGSTPSRVILGCSHVGIVPDDAAGGRVSSGMFGFTPALRTGARAPVMSLAVISGIKIIPWTLLLGEGLRSALRDRNDSLSQISLPLVTSLAAHCLSLETQPLIHSTTPLQFRFGSLSHFYIDRPGHLEDSKHPESR